MQTPAHKLDSNKLLKIFNNDQGLLEFYNEWVSNGKNATRAYLKLHPNVKVESAKVLGHNKLTSINFKVIMREYGLSEDVYFKQLGEGINATKWNDFTGDREPDHKTRLPYHDKVGKLLGIESDQPNQTNVQVNFGDFVKNV